ncbi:hypothetical protein PG985_011284 [Apiospora marii]|uniref:uncharacterized protein n=1 Tax=Apiospora marii TaxID=335849 RepID=UPI00312FC62D
MDNSSSKFFLHCGLNLHQKRGSLPATGLLDPHLAQGIRALARRLPDGPPAGTILPPSQPQPSRLLPPRLLPLAGAFLFYEPGPLRLARLLHPPLALPFPDAAFRVLVLLDGRRRPLLHARPVLGQHLRGGVALHVVGRQRGRALGADEMGPVVWAGEQLGLEPGLDAGQARPGGVVALRGEEGGGGERGGGLGVGADAAG